eukprot:NODE_1354_length_1187_cov_94.130931_g1112_i0.p1 GENE.NODE_1354_length_1187_cov_94.130931_g1112_i0~~NODE_1354_length_1187_cov_94.130931_g1112_i0.p1  ORF type:complete len:138 (-),score=15.26 NODE_1354_length_1187_cov_94.130931_g1112_i0:60-473(-)
MTVPIMAPPMPATVMPTTEVYQPSTAPPMYYYPPPQQWNGEHAPNNTPASPDYRQEEYLPQVEHENISRAAHIPQERSQLDEKAAFYEAAMDVDGSLLDHKGHFYDSDIVHDGNTYSHTQDAQFHDDNERFLNQHYH